MPTVGAVAVLVLVPGLLTGPPEGVEGTVVDPFDGGAPDWDALADAVVPDEPVVLVARSLGTAVAVRAALRHPDRVAALVLVRPAVGVEPRADLAELAVAARRLGLAQVWARLSLPGEPPTGLDHDLDLLEALGRLPLLRDADDLGAVQAPTLLVAMAGDRLHPMEVAHLYWRRIPTSRLVNEVPGDPAFDLGPAVDRFLAEVM